MAILDDFVRSIKIRIDSSLEQWFKMVPVTIASVATDGSCLVTIQGSTDTYPAVLMAGQTGTVGDSGYGLWHPGRTRMMVIKAANKNVPTDIDWTALATTGGTARYMVLAGMCTVQLNVTFPSTGASANVSAIASGLPVGVRPVSNILAVGFGSSVNNIARIDVTNTGNVNATPLTGTMSAAVSMFSFPAGK